MRYLQINAGQADGYICPWRDKRCLGTLCMAWIPSDDEVMEDFGRCGLVPGEE
jgi:hypothetical protein